MLVDCDFELGDEAFSVGVSFSSVGHCTELISAGDR